jgi:type I restriction enzyme S subunit
LGTASQVQGHLDLSASTHRRGLFGGAVSDPAHGRTIRYRPLPRPRGPADSAKYIRAKQKLIKLLEEQKQAIIHRAVTRGLDPSVRLKHSGVDSLGDVPEHWDVQRLKALVTEAVAGPYGSSLTKAMYTSDGYRVYGQQQVIPDDFATGDYFISPAKFEQMKQYRVLPGDILVSVMGTVGRVAVVPDNVEPGIINPRLVRYRPDFSRVRPRYLQLTMQSPPSRAQIVEASKGTTMEGLNMQVLGQLRINLPPLTEQDAILGAISHKASALQRASNDAGREITLLREYRTRLIADVVTGKLDVREAAARLPDEAAECEALDEIGDLDLPEDAMAEDLDAAVEESGE